MDAVQAANSGHPEYRWTSGVGTTTGPLGQGLATSVGMAAATRVSVELASTFGWERYVGTGGQAPGIKPFGASASLKELQKKFGFTPERVAEAAREQLRLARR